MANNQAPPGGNNDNVVQLRQQAIDAAQRLADRNGELERDMQTAVRQLETERANARTAAEQHRQEVQRLQAAHQSVAATHQTQQEEEMATLTRILAIIGGAAVAVAIIVGSVYLGNQGYINLRPGQQQAAAPTTPAVTAADIKTIVDESATKIGAKIDGVKTDFANRFTVASDDLAERVKAHREALDALKTGQSTIVTAVADVKTEFGDRLKAVEIETGKSTIIMSGLTDKLASIERASLAAAPAPVPAPASAVAAPAPATAAPAAPAPATSFVWPAKLTDRQNLVYAKCNEPGSWKDIDIETSIQLLSTYTAEQAAKFFSDSGDCGAFITQATNVTKIKRQFEGSQEPEATQAAVTTTPTTSTRVARNSCPSGSVFVSQIGNCAPVLRR